MKEDKIRQIIEAIIIATDEPVSIERIRQALEEVTPKQIKDQVENLKREYREFGRSFKIDEVAGGYQISTKPKFASYLRKLYKADYVERLSKPSLETLAIVAYKQPVTRLDIESIRGVNVDRVLKNLLEKGLIKIKGRKEVIGRPYIYITTKLFLKYFGLRSIEDLPDIEDFKKTADQVFKIREDSIKENEYES
jgi:segregation and condensation protein B